MRRRAVRSCILAALIASAAALGCGGEDPAAPLEEDPVPEPTGVRPGSVQLVEGGADIDTIDALRTVVVRVTHLNGAPMSGAVLSFSGGGSGSTISAAKDTTDAQGLASTTWRLPPRPGSVRLDITASPLPSVRITVDVRRGAAHEIRLDPSSVRLGAVGDSTHVQPVVTDRRGNVIHAWADFSASPLASAAYVSATSNIYAITALAPGEGALEVRAAGLVGTLPIEVLTLDAIVTGQDQSCGVDVSGRVYCWSYSNYGNSDPSTRSPKPVVGVVSGEGVTLGRYSTCVLETGRSALCWGGNRYGEIGIGSRAVHIQEPSAVTLPEGMIQLSGGRTSYCAVDGAGAVYCWGSDAFGELGHGPALASCYTEGAICADRPVKVASQERFTFVDVGQNHHACAVTETGAIFCWGNNAARELGSPDPGTPCVTSGFSCHRTPVRVETNLAFTQVAAGERFTCALTEDGRAFCWGAGTTPLGPVTTSSHVPTLVEGGLSFEQVDVWDRYACGRSNGAIYCWGDSYGRVPVRQQSPHEFTSLSVGNGRICGTINSGGAACLLMRGP